MHTPRSGGMVLSSLYSPPAPNYHATVPPLACHIAHPDVQHAPVLPGRSSLEERFDRINWIHRIGACCRLP